MAHRVKDLPAIQQTHRRHEFKKRRVEKIPWRRKPTQVLPEISRGQRSLAGYSPKDCKESDTT